jgi:hypothetical protein
MDEIPLVSKWKDGAKPRRRRGLRRPGIETHEPAIKSSSGPAVKALPKARGRLLTLENDRWLK